MSDTPRADANVKALAEKMLGHNPPLEKELHIEALTFHMPGALSVDITATDKNMGLRLYLEAIAAGPMGRRPSSLKWDAYDKSHAAEFWAEKWLDRESVPRHGLVALGKADSIGIRWKA